jgi:sulfite reductase (ferredoxin)
MDKQNSWREKLAGKIPAELGREIDIFEQQMELRKTGKIDEKVFAETRLRRGIYGQRYDNGHRHDGNQSRDIPFPSMIRSCLLAALAAGPGRA